MDERRYFLLYGNAGGIVGTLAPISELNDYIHNLKQNPVAAVVEVGFDEWLPYAWDASDYTSPPPTDLTEEEFWQAEYF